jgi:hypothetical protein
VEIRLRNLDTRSKVAAGGRFYTACVPLEGHWQKVNTPLRETTRREKLLVRVALAVGVIAAVVLVIASIGSSSPSTPAGCIHVELPSTMGAVASDLCGDTAREFCRSPAAHTEPLNHTALPRCRDAGLE